MKFEEWSKKFRFQTTSRKNINDLWTDADILIGMYNKAKHEIKDREELLSRREVALLFLD